MTEAVCFKGWIVGFVFVLAFAVGGDAVARMVERDTDGDGKVDRVGHFNASGRLVKLEVDGDRDSHFELVQEYEDELLCLVRRDLDKDRRFDCFDYYEKGRHSRQERFSTAGELTQRIEFDGKGNPLRVRRDTTSDGRLDTTQTYEKGIIVASVLDVDGNGIDEVRQEFRQGVLSKRFIDSDQDRRFESVYHCDGQGRPSRSEHDFDGDGRYEVTRAYDRDHVVRQEKRDHSDRVSELMLFAGGVPIRSEKDTVSDGRRDLVIFFENGRPVRQEQDTDGSGRVDTFRLLDEQGAPYEIRRDEDGDGKVDGLFRLRDGAVELSRHDEDRDGRMETVCRYEKGVRKVLERDENGDGRVEHRELYAEDGLCTRMETDSRGDGKIDTRQDFADGKAVYMEMDESGGGRVNVRVWFRNGEKSRLERDADGDGRFEIVQRYGVDGWDMVLFLDADGNGKPEACLRYREGLLRQKELFLPDGDLECAEYFNERGELEKSRERESDGLTLTWFYDGQGNPLRAERDRDLNGVSEEVFFYRGGAICRVDVDTNGDGRADLWEEYDEKGNLAATAQDMDFDGEPDLVKGQRQRDKAQGRVPESL